MFYRVQLIDQYRKNEERCRMLLLSLEAVRCLLRR